ncbi:hypothetical protein M3Y99_01480500 [Aphelenchoides fujianensis]|nr:hypothetical protein M3Y99_01480500 [Aphelenchoides fujianensis]
MTVPCKICGGEPSAIHFGGRSCRSCKAFFRRCLKLNRSYKCALGHECVISKTARFYCRGCRWRLCLEAGMDPKLVHCDRARNEELHSAITSKEQESSPLPPDPCSTKAVAIQHFIADHDGPLGFRSPPATFGDAADFSAHLRFFRDVDRFVAHFEDPQADFHSNCNVNVSIEEGFLYAPRLLSQRTKMSWEPVRSLVPGTFLPVGCRSVVHFVDLVSHIPEVHRLNSSDLFRLLVAKNLDIRYLITMQQTLVHTSAKCLVFPWGVCLPPEDEGFAQAKGNKFLSNTVDISLRLYEVLMEPLKEACLNEEEFIFLRLLAFFTGAGKLSKEGREIVRKARLHYESLFIRYLCSRMERRPAVDRMTQILTLLPLVEQAAALQKNWILSSLLFTGVSGNFTRWVDLAE